MTERPSLHNVTEREQRASSDFVGLQVRLLLTGDALNPANTSLGVITPEQLGTFENRDYSPFGNLSQSERRTHWEGRQGDAAFSWKQGFKTKLQNAEHFFSTTEKGMRWAQFLGMFGTPENRLDATDPTDAAIEAIYTRYFVGPEMRSHVQQYVGDVLRIFQGNEDAPNPAVLHEYADVIEWMGGIFGERTAILSTLLAEGEAILKTPRGRELLVQAAGQVVGGHSRVNGLDQEEKDFLAFLWRESQEEAPEVPVPPQSTIEPQAPLVDRTHPDSSPPEQAPIVGVADAEAVARGLLNYDTGVASEEHDLSRSFPELVERVEQLIAENEQLFPPGVRTIVLSDVAYEMIQSIAAKANERDVELAFEMHGIALVNDDKEVGVAAFAVPTMDFSQAEQLRVRTFSDIHERHANALTDNTHLEEYFRARSGTRNGNFILSCHTHQRQAGVPVASQRDFTQYRDNALNTGEQQPWAIFTLHRNRLLSKTYLTYRDSSGGIRHFEGLQLKKQSDLPDLDSDRLAA